MYASVCAGDFTNQVEILYTACGIKIFNFLCTRSKIPAKMSVRDLALTIFLVIWLKTRIQMKHDHLMNPKNCLLLNFMTNKYFRHNSPDQISIYK